MNNVFKYGWMSWRYPHNWWGNIKLAFRQWKWAYQRATRGYCDYDIWDFSSYLLDVLSGGLKHLADNHYGWPGTGDFPTDEEWTQFLNDMSDKFYRAQESNDYYPAPMAEKWWDWYQVHLDKMFDTKSENPYIDEMLDESRENEEKRERDFAEAWSAIGEHFWCLWD